MTALEDCGDIMRELIDGGKSVPRLSQMDVSKQPDCLTFVYLYGQNAAGAKLDITVSFFFLFFLSFFF